MRIEGKVKLIGPEVSLQYNPHSAESAAARRLRFEGCTAVVLSKPPAGEVDLLQNVPDVGMLD
jgi:hypothetical protein